MWSKWKPPARNRGFGWMKGRLWLCKGVFVFFGWLCHVMSCICCWMLFCLFVCVGYVMFYTVLLLKLSKVEGFAAKTTGG